MYIENPDGGPLRDWVMNPPAEIHFCSDCGHSLTIHGPADETDRLPCREINCPCTAYGEEESHATR